MNLPWRFALLALAAGLLVAAPAAAQQPRKSYRIGILDASGRTDAPYYKAFHERLRELGFVEGRNLVIVSRSGKARTEDLGQHAAELAGAHCDVFVAPGNEAVLVALERQTVDTPIVVMAVDYDPQATGHVASLAHPGGRITGVSAIQSVLPAKRLEILKELLPEARTIAVLSDVGSTGQLEVARSAAGRLNVQLEVLEFKRVPYDYKAAFAQASRHKADALLALGSANFVPARPLIPKLAIEHHLPSMFHNSVWAEAGGLVSYGPNFSDVFRQAAEQVGRILNGAKAGDLPIGQPTKFELVINAKTARALGITVPREMLLRADRVIE